MKKNVLFSSFSYVFDRFQPCERMRKHAFADQNTQQVISDVAYQNPVLLNVRLCSTIEDSLITPFTSEDVVLPRPLLTNSLAPVGPATLPLTTT